MLPTLGDEDDAPAGEGEDDVSKLQGRVMRRMLGSATTATRVAGLCLAMAHRSRGIGRSDEMSPADEPANGLGEVEPSLPAFSLEAVVEAAPVDVDANPFHAVSRLTRKIMGLQCSPTGVRSSCPCCPGTGL